VIWNNDLITVSTCRNLCMCVTNCLHDETVQPHDIITSFNFYGTESWSLRITEGGLEEAVKRTAT